MLNKHLNRFNTHTYTAELTHCEFDSYHVWLACDLNTNKMIWDDVRWCEMMLIGSEGDEVKSRMGADWKLSAGSAVCVCVCVYSEL